MKKGLKALIILSVLLIVGCTHFGDPLMSTEPTTTSSTDEPEQSTEPTTTGSTDEPVQSSEHNLFIHMIDVGQGDSTFIVLPNGETILIDAGVREAGDTVIDYLDTLGINTIDYVIGTHPDADHIGGLVKVIPAFTIHNLFLPDKTHTSKLFEDLLETIAHKGLEIDIGEKGVKLVDTMIDDLVLRAEIISPHPDRISEYDNNNASIVLMLTYGSKRFLFMGDAEETVEEDLLNDGIDIQADVLKVGHHGSKTSTTEAFLQKVKPSIALISAGKENRYGHPHQEIIDRLTVRGIQIFRTDELGTVIVTSNGDSIAVNEYELPDLEPTEPVMLYINELMPNPENGDEWIELYNPNEEAVSLGGFYLLDEVGNRLEIERGVVIPAKGYYVLYLNRVLNNDQDTVYLYDGWGNLLDQFSYTKTEKGKSFYRQPDGREWAEKPGDPTPNETNGL